jgi:hypothetical protein
MLMISEPNTKDIYGTIHSKLQATGNAVGNKLCTSAKSEKLLVCLLHFP